MRIQRAPKRKQPARHGRPKKGKAGVEQALTAHRDWTKRAAAYLDRRLDKQKPITRTEVQRHLYRRRLTDRQARTVLLVWLVAGYLAADEQGQLRDARALWSGDASATQTMVQRTRAAAFELMTDFSAELQRRLGFQLEALEQRLEAWGSLALDATPGERREARRARTVSRQEHVVMWLEDAAARDATGDWTEARTEEWAAAYLSDLLATTGIEADQQTAAQWHRQAVERVKDARGLGVTEAAARRELMAMHRYQRERADDRSIELEKVVRPGKPAAIRPLVSRVAFKRLFTGPGWSPFSRPEVVTIIAESVTTQRLTNPAENMLDSQRTGTQKLSGPKDVVQEFQPPNGPAEKSIQDRVDGDHWVGLSIGGLVDLFSWAHEAIYGVSCDSELAQHRVAAVVAAGKLVADEFTGSAEAAVEYVRWVWAREEQREHWRRANTAYGKVLTWRQVFVDRGLVVQYRLDQARKAGVA